MKKLFLSLLLALPTLTLSADICGKYKVTGSDPVLEKDYSGTAYIKKNGDVYNIYWAFDDGSQSAGTGLLVDDQFSVVYDGIGSPSGVEVYKVKEHHGRYTLEGPWVNLGDNRVGSEKLCEIHH